MWSDIMKSPCSVGREKYYFPAVIVIATLAAVLLACGTYKINFWPSDSYNPYAPTAARLFELPHLSLMHTLPDQSLNQLNMRGKEALILGIALMQRLLGDTRSLYPNVLLLILAVWVSSLVIYKIFLRMFGAGIALAGFLFFATSFWTYQYILQGAHQPLVMMNFLLSLFFLQRAFEKESLYCVAGFFMGFMFFSSPTAAIYLPYFLLLGMDPRLTSVRNWSWARILRNAGLFCAGAAAPFLLFTWPDPLGSLKRFSHFLGQSQFGNHFSYYQGYLAQQFPFPFESSFAATFRGGGWLWILKYFFLIMPVMFGVYLVCLIYLLGQGVARRRLLVVILISVSTPLGVEFARVSQFGRTYFSWLFGIIFLICFTLAYGKKNVLARDGSRGLAKKTQALPATVFLIHLVFNIFIFATDVFPTRMATTYLDAWVRQRRISRLLVYQNHPRNFCTTDMMNNPKLKDTIRFYGIKNIRQPEDGYILVPPVSGNTIWDNCASEDFGDDPDLSELIRSGGIKDVAVAAFPTLVTSRIWPQEEEVCAYRDLMLGQRGEPEKGYIYILDVEKLKRARPGL